MRATKGIQRGSDLKKKKKVIASKICKFFGQFKRSPGKKCLLKLFRKLSGALKDEIKVVMTLTNFQQVKK